MRARWVGESFCRAGQWAHYEPYGRESHEKESFIMSINDDHPLWGKNPEFKIDELAAERGNVLYPRNAPVKIKRAVHFDEIGHHFNEDGGKDVTIDGGERKDRISWSTSTMLAEFVEKCSPEDRSGFFDYGGVGRKYVSDQSKKAGILRRMEEIEKKINENSNSKIALSDITVKDYPKHHFRHALERMRQFIENGSRLNVGAQEFTPQKTNSKPKTLKRTSPKKICGAYVIDKPMKPVGPPPPQRPKTNHGDSASRLLWVMKNESDRQIKELDHKIDLLIQMNGPVVEAEQI
jgi:hypothetical protein